jgi:hypothetical protein
VKYTRRRIICHKYLTNVGIIYLTARKPVFEAVIARRQADPVSLNTIAPAPAPIGLTKTAGAIVVPNSGNIAAASGKL